MEGAFQSDSVYASYAPDNVPTPMGFGEFKSQPDTWFYVCEFHDMVDELPDVNDLVEHCRKSLQDQYGKIPNWQIWLRRTNPPCQYSKR